MMVDLAIAIKPEPVKPLTAADVQACIQAHFGAGGEQYAVLFEVRNGTAWNANRSVDAVVMGLWPSLGMELWGIEIKVSRGDWLREVRDPGKASKVFDYFDRWFLVAPDAAAKMDELPEPWGWLVPENGRLRKVRDAAKNPNVKAADRHFLGALLRRVARTDDAFVQARLQAALTEQRRVFNAEIEHKALEQVGESRAAAEQWIKLRDMLKQKPDDYIYQPDVIEALRVLMKAGIGKSYSSLTSLLAATGQMHEQLSKIAGDLGVDKPQPRKRRGS